MGFHQIFLLKNINDAWVCTNDMFRLALHNFGWAGNPEAPQLYFCLVVFFSFSPLTGIIHTHRTFQISYTNLQHCGVWAKQELWPALLLSLHCQRWVSCAWCLEVRLRCIWQEKFVLYQHASERSNNAKGCCYVLTRCSITQRHERTAACTAQILICSDVPMLRYTIKPWDFLNSLNCFSELDME